METKPPMPGLLSTFFSYDLLDGAEDFISEILCSLKAGNLFKRRRLGIRACDLLSTT